MTDLTVTPDTYLASLATRINSEHEAAESAVNKALDHARQCGELLAEAKRMLASGTTRQVAEVCSWCRKGVTASDDVLLQLGAKASHGICPECRDEHFGGEAS